MISGVIREHLAQATRAIPNYDEGVPSDLSNMTARRKHSLAVLLTLATTAFALALESSASARPTRLTVKVGTNRTYTRTQLHPGETVLCRYKGRALSVTAPTGSEEGAGAGWPKPGTTDRSIFTLNVNVTTNRAFDVTCVRGGYHSALATIP